MLEKIKALLGIETEERDSLLNIIIELTTSRLKMLLGGADVPADLVHVVVEVSVARFNRIGSEGLSTHTVEGESLTYSESDFEPYSAEIQAYLNKQAENSRGKVRFL